MSPEEKSGAEESGPGMTISTPARFCLTQLRIAPSSPPSSLARCLRVDTCCAARTTDRAGHIYPAIKQSRLLPVRRILRSWLFV